MKADMDLTLSEDDTVSGTMILAISNEVAEELGMNPEDVWDQGRGELGDSVPEGATEEPYSDGEYTGGKYSFDAQSIEEFSRDASPELSITREGDEYVVSGEMDLTDEQGDLAGAPPEMLETLDLRVAVTFPGEVLETDGEVVGTSTVEWRPQPGEVNEMRARGSAVAGGAEDAPATGGEPGAAAGDGFPWWVVGALVGVVALAVVVVLVLRANRPRPVATTDGTLPPPPDRPAGTGGLG
jgi:hypothetical protein